MVNLKKIYAWLRWYVSGLMLEKGKPSLTRFLAVAAFFLFAWVTAYLVLMGKEWGPYGAFASLTGGGGMLMQLVNKVNNTNKVSNDSGEGL